MSIWTQVEGTVTLQNLNREEIIKRLGTPFDYDYIHENGFPKDNPIPSGSEGSLNYKISKDCTKIFISGSIRSSMCYESILDWVLRLSELDEDGFDKNISFARMQLTIGEPLNIFIYQGFLTNGEYWEHYRKIPQKVYEKIPKEWF